MREIVLHLYTYYSRTSREAVVSVGSGFDPAIYITLQSYIMREIVLHLYTYYSRTSREAVVSVGSGFDPATYITLQSYITREIVLHLYTYYSRTSPRNSSPPTHFHFSRTSREIRVSRESGFWSRYILLLQSDITWKIYTCYSRRSREYVTVVHHTRNSAPPIYLLQSYITGNRGLQRAGFDPAVCSITS